jgi:DNA recombination-dependent growth factor C
MGLLAGSVTVCRFKVEGRIETPLLESVAQGLGQQRITDMDAETDDKRVGWTHFSQHYKPDFSGSSFVMGDYFVFALRIDKKSIPAALLRQQYSIALDRYRSESGRDLLSRGEKSQIKEEVINSLYLRLPAVPSVFDVVWHYEKERLYFFSTQKAANDELENLFNKSFGLHLVRLFPFSMADLTLGLGSAQRDALQKTTPTRFRI